MKIIDTRGELCPKPIIKTKKEIPNIAVNESFKILTDNDTSLKNLLRFLKDNHFETDTISNDDFYTIMCIKKDKELNNPDAESYCVAPINNDYIIVFKTDKMGVGNDDLGSILIKAFINSLPEQNKLPKAMIFYNSSVLLTKDSSNVYESLRLLQSKGVEIVICGTCIDFYDIKNEIDIGIVSNMFTITEYMIKYSHIIYP
ncbi:MAG: sulfurtransferase-like selenium metabolism protein YedF [Candidatus Cloacimonadales bacterium]|mgnify:CR=1 FL=1|jgi:selenium metabolism protein YedF|nr:sulfurtransferase-like selenium metabolism protein YedF [Candidatus Cloacimonadota bacterium]MDD2650903.1 sulfurtransferase-like selenium metabolism protein YedF [Candidatus Cloacimonadota bacterium]MDX9976820.1 sulfurtransferase-like selenium metabolism protein YedF [Candidatus Cloacimonadales bacterium]